ncbi:MAG: hypothetical protein E7256_12165 [Lachnospiraceae bacterium]|nr:hypothetical protein [Lachnospiraceae bacterium]
MMMKIFTNELLKEEELDFTRWETFNGDYVDISMVGTPYIERCMDMLEQFMERYPAHKNYPIWKQYMEIFEDELQSRETELIGSF